jgi:SSS family solute:Na+ symporter
MALLMGSGAPQLVSVALVSANTTPFLRKPLTFSAGLLILPLYFLVTIAIGWMARRHNPSANAYLNASRSLPLWVVVAAYLAANCGALEIIGLSAMAAQYGVPAFNFYWIGAIPAMVFLANWMMPIYRRSGVRSVPEYLEFRYGPGLKLLNACVLAITMLLLAGVSLYAMAQVLLVVVGLSFSASTLLAAGVVLAYVLLGGVKATIYNEVFQLAVMLAGLLPVAILSFRSGVVPSGAQAARWHLWTSMPAVSRAAPLDVFGVVVGLGFVLSFGYWCTDFVLMQRAFTARTEKAAMQVPLWAGFGKLLFSMIVVLPGLAAYRLLPELGHTRRFDQALPALMTISYGPVMLGLGLTALLASLMSGLAANVSAFAAIWTEDIYRSRLVRDRSDSHYLLIGRISASVAIAISLLTSYIDFLFGSLMEHVQLIFSVFSAPFWAIFLLGMGTRRTTERGAIAGFLTGTTVALLHLAATSLGWLHYGSVMNANFHVAIYAFSSAAVVGWLASSRRSGELSSSAPRLVFQWRSAFRDDDNRLLWILSAILLSACLILNWIWR